jgi:hypothetical protein
VALSRLVNSLKGVGSRLLLRDRPELRRYARKGLWSPSYFAASAGGAPLDVVKAYVANQRVATWRALSLPAVNRQGFPGLRVIYRSQFSTCSPRTRENSLVLSVTRMAPTARA